jgi:hypothetical protein
VSRASLIVASVLSASAACTKQGFLAAPEADPTITAKVGSFAPDMHFLVEPTGDAEDLLGRAVHVTSAGGWTIADERAPGCNVRVKRSSADYEKSYRMGLGDLTALSGGYGELLKLEARYGRSVEAEMKVHNLETLTADTEGDCGEVIVKSVRIGTGERKLLRKADGAAKVHVGKGPIGVSAGREAATDAADEIRWSTPQAYAFSYEGGVRRKVFELDARIPDSLRDGERFTLKFRASEDAYLVAYYLEESGEGAVLFPDAALPVPMVAAGSTFVFPPEGHKQLEAQLRDPTIAVHETIVVYAFAERADFDRFRPAALTASTDALAYAAELTNVLSSIPISRWDRHSVTIEITPNAETSTP